MIEWVGDFSGFLTARTYHTASTIEAHCPVFILVDPVPLHYPVEMTGYIIGWNAQLPSALVTELAGMNGQERVSLFLRCLKAVGISMQNSNAIRKPCAVIRQDLLDWSVISEKSWSPLNNVFTRWKRGTRYCVLGLKLWYRPDMLWADAGGRMRVPIVPEAPPARPSGVEIDVWADRAYCGQIMGTVRMEPEAKISHVNGEMQPTVCMRTMVLMAQPSPCPSMARCGPAAIDALLHPGGGGDSGLESGGDGSDGDSGSTSDDSDGFADGTGARGLFNSDDDDDSDGDDFDSDGDSGSI